MHTFKSKRYGKFCEVIRSSPFFKCPIPPCFTKVRNTIHRAAFHNNKYVTFAMFSCYQKFVRRALLRADDMPVAVLHRHDRNLALASEHES